MGNQIAYRRDNKLLNEFPNHLHLSLILDIYLPNWICSFLALAQACAEHNKMTSPVLEIHLLDLKEGQPNASMCCSFLLWKPSYSVLSTLFLKKFIHVCTQIIVLLTYNASFSIHIWFTNKLIYSPILPFTLAMNPFKKAMKLDYLCLQIRRIQAFFSNVEIRPKKLEAILVISIRSSILLSVKMKLILRLMGKNSYNDFLHFVSSPDFQSDNSLPSHSSKIYSRHHILPNILLSFQLCDIKTYLPFCWNPCMNGCWWLDALPMLGNILIF